MLAAGATTRNPSVLPCERMELATTPPVNVAPLKLALLFGSKLAECHSSPQLVQPCTGPFFERTAMRGVVMLSAPTVANSCVL
ncbi:hypothetical protein D9M70_577560 [compost metagenome]